MKGDARGGGLEGGQHGGRGQRAQAVLVVDRVHRGQQARAVLLLLRSIKEVQRMQSSGHQAVQMHADEVRTLELLAGRAGFP